MMTAREILRKRQNWRALVQRALGSAEAPPQPGELQHYLGEWLTAFGVVHKRKPGIEEYPAVVSEFLIIIGHVKPKRGRPRCDEQRLLAARRAWDSGCYSEAYSLWHGLFRHLGWIKGSSFDGYIKGDQPSESALGVVADRANMEVEALRARILRGKSKVSR